MGEEFVFFRLPGEETIYHISGRFEPAVNIGEYNGFYLQPFDNSQEILILKGTPEIFSEKNRPSDMELHFSGDQTEGDSTKDYWLHYIEKIKSSIRNGDIRKCVPARISKRKKNGMPVTDAFNKACAENTNALVYLLSSKQYGTWIGATPEVLLQGEGDEMQTMALAGTIFNEEEKWSEKENEENRATADYIREILTEEQVENLRTESAGELKSGHLRHLVVRFRFSYTFSGIGSMIKKLHPTPAVAGMPKSKALKIIGENEPFNRSLYAGWLGISVENRFNAWVNLRCAQIQADHVILYAGAGVNQLSDADREWTETELKMNVIGKYLSS